LHSVTPGHFTDAAGPYTFYSFMTAHGASLANPANWLSLDAAPTSKNLRIEQMRSAFSPQFTPT
jgi:hypothetical protein